MKKIILVLLTIFAFTGVANSNWDRVESIRYKGEFKGNVTIGATIENTACNTGLASSSSYVTGNIFPYLNSSDNDCRISDGKLVCSLAKSMSGINPAGTVTKKVLLNAKYSDVLRSIGVPEKLLEGNNEILTIENNLELTLVTNSNGVDLGVGLKKDLNVSLDTLNIKYQDETECGNSTCKTKSQIEAIKAEHKKILDGIKDLKKKDLKKKELEKELEKVKECKTPGVMSFCEKDSNGKCLTKEGGNITAGIKPGKLDVFAVVPSKPFYKLGENCFYDRNVPGDNFINYYCYASNELGIAFSLSDLGDGVDNVWLSVNNAENTGNPFGVDERGQDIPNNFHFSNNGVNFPLKKEVYFNVGGDHSLFPKKVGKYTLVLQGFKGNDPAYGTGAVGFRLTITPNPNGLIGEVKERTEIQKVGPGEGEVYANNFSGYRYLIAIKDKFGNYLPDELIKLLSVKCKDCIKTKNNLEGINVHSYYTKYFFISSLVPTEKEGKELNFDGTIPKWYPDGYIAPTVETNFILNGGNVAFKKPIVFDSISFDGGNINVSKEQDYTINLRDVGSFHFFDIYEKKISKRKITGINSNNIAFESDGEKFNSSIVNKDYELLLDGTQKLYANFKAIVKATKNEKILSKINVIPKNLGVEYSYNKGGKEYIISYPLDDLQSIEGQCSTKTTGLVVNGMVLGKGKDNYTSEINTFSKLPKSHIRKEIIQKTYNLTKALKNGDQVNGILYYEGDQTYSAVKGKLKENDSLVIKNGNLFLDENVTGDIGIVVFTDNNKGGNIYVKNTVETINAYIFADGGFISGDKNGGKYTDEELRKHKLDLNGTLISSNTIGGSEKGDSSCFLPGNKKTEDCGEAERYDLNYIRKHIITCDLDDKNNYSFKINYNPKIKLNTPRVFK